MSIKSKSKATDDLVFGVMFSDTNLYETLKKDQLSLPSNHYLFVLFVFNK